ncbi:LADA_0A04566g1_1 [Lachancea dasiensis]|uniref:LADA_0A04566g1_1 n=1 Tax=Lachancea dasiensis TaxID=1072105 RepID=A0A1G4INK1_9SACH|nr:LADA_0A04566g1_1 [Lachancea dasiensis]
MKSLRWTSKSRKSSTSAADSRHTEHHKNSTDNNPTNFDSSETHEDDPNPPHSQISIAKRPTIFNKHLTSPPSVYLSENNIKSNRSLSSGKEPATTSDPNERGDTGHEDSIMDDDRSTMVSQARSEQPGQPSEPLGPTTNFNSENYDNYTFKIGWVNKAGAGQAMSNRDSRLYINGNTSMESQSHGKKAMNYRIHRATLRGTVLSLYKSGISNVKFFNPNLPPPAHLAEQQSRGGDSYQTNSSEHNHHNASDDQSTLVERQRRDLAYLSSEFPHPDLKCDSDGRLISGSNESICHMILFCPPFDDTDTKRIIDILLILPLIDKFGAFLNIFQIFGVTFTKHRSKLVNSARQHHQISAKVDFLMTERLAMVVKAVLDVFSGFLLNDKLFSQIVDLVDVISLHDDEISTNLKMAIVERQNKLNALCAFTKQKVTSVDVQSLTSRDYFLKMDLDDFAIGVHQINLKFMAQWSPQVDYSLLYESNFIDTHINLNPMIFRNSENVHFLGRLLVTHLFSDQSNSSQEQTADVLSAWVKLGCKFEKIGDMVSWLAIATVVCSIPVLRLISTWELVSEQTLKIIFKDWVPTIVQLDRRQISSKSANSVFILAPPNLNEAYIRENVIPFFGDLSISANDLPTDTKFKYLEKKIHRTKNAFFKWQQRIDQARKDDAGGQKFQIDQEPCHSTNIIYRYWQFHLQQTPMNIESIMKLSLELQPPVVSQQDYSATSSRRSALLTGSYLPMLFNELLPSYSLFPRDYLIGAAGVTADSGEYPKRGVNIRKISGPQIPGHEHDSSGITGVERLDEPVVKEISSKTSNKQKLLKLIRDAFNIDMDMFHISDGIIFKSANEIEGRSRPASVVIETPKRLSQHSSFNAMRDSQDITRLGAAIESLDIFSSIGRSSGSINECQIQVVLKSATLDKLFDVLVLTTSVFSKVIDTGDLEKYLSHERKRRSVRDQTPDSGSVGPLDYAFVRLLMDNDVFTETFFNTYKSFTTTTVVLENLAKRFIGAMSGAVSISRVMTNDKQKYGGTSNSNRFSGFVDVTSNNSRFPAWDLKVNDTDEINLGYVAKIQVGAMEALLHLVSLHYADFTDSLANNGTFLDILKIMDQEVNEEWKRRIEVLGRTKHVQLDSKDEINELENLHTTLKTLFKRLKSMYQKQLYRPLGVSKAQRMTQLLLKKSKAVSLRDMSDQLKDDFGSGLHNTFNTLHCDNYTELSNWIYELDNIVSNRMSLITNQDWVDTSQLLDLFSNESLTSLYRYPLHSISQNIVLSGGSRLDDLEIINVFSWLRTLSGDNGGSIFDKLPPSIKLMVKLHESLTNFFILHIGHSHHTAESRVDVCAIVLQLLALTRLKNTSIDLFHDSEKEKSISSISPHVPSFLESCLCNAVVAPDSRYFEMHWKNAYTKLLGSDATDVRDFSTMLAEITKQAEKFADLDQSQLYKTKNLAPCPGWLITRLLEISQFVPNMSIENSKMINFDKRRFVNNVIINYREMIPHPAGQHDDSNPGLTNDFIASVEIVDAGKAFRKLAKETAAAEARKCRYQATGLFNHLIAAEVDKVKRDHKKMMQLTVQDNDSKRKKLLEQAVRQRNRLSSASSVHDLNSHLAYRGSSVDSDSATKRTSYAANSSSRASMISNATQSNGSMGRKLGGFFKRPFSIGGFSTSSSAHGLNAILLNGAQSNGSISPYELPDINSSVFKDTKPLYSIRTFEIKSCIPVNGVNKLPETDYSFKIVTESGLEHIIQATDYSDMKDWLRVINLSKRYSFHSQKYKGKTSNKIFGVPIEDVCEREGSIIPNIVVKLLEEIELRGLDEMGLYRVPGSVGSINALKNAFDEEGAVSNTFTLEDDRWFEINTIAGCFKLYLRALPDSLFTKEKLPTFVSLALSYKSLEIDWVEFTSKVRDALRSLPLCNFHMMKRTFEHLNRVDQHVENNRMDAINLAIVFSMSFIDQDNLASSMGPTLGALQTILQLFIRKPDDFF